MKKIKLISRMNDHFAITANELLIKCRLVLLMLMLTACYDFDVVPSMEEQQYKKPVASDSVIVLADTVRVKCAVGL